MDALTALSIRIVVQMCRELTWDVLYQGAAERDVHDLNPTANRECREPPATGLQNQRDLALVAFFVSLDGRMRGLAVPAGSDVFATRDHEAGETVEHSGDFRRGKRWND
jgi:hypothetical protein